MPFSSSDCVFVVDTVRDAHERNCVEYGFEVSRSNGHFPSKGVGVTSLVASMPAELGAIDKTMRGIADVDGTLVMETGGVDNRLQKVREG